VTIKVIVMTHRQVHVCALICAPLLTGNVSHIAAQTTPAPQWSSIVITKIKPEARAEYESLQKELMAAYKKAGIPSRAVLQTVFGDLNEYVSVMPIAKFSNLDGAPPLEQALGAEGYAKIRRRLGLVTHSLHRIATLSMPELSINTPTETPAPFAMVVTYTLAPGRGRDWETFIRDEALPMYRKAEVPNVWVSRTLFGGESLERVVVRPMIKLGEIDDGPITQRVLGTEGAAQFLAKSAGLHQSVRYRIVRYRNDLSYAPQPARVSRRD
jgi:hypothetical protein